MRYGLTDPDDRQDSKGGAFPAQSTVLDEVALERRVLPGYRIPPSKSCRFYDRGDADIYRVITDEKTYYLKVYRPPRTRERAETEAQFVNALADGGAPVVRAVSRFDGNCSTEVMATEGPRPMLLFEEAPTGKFRPQSSGECVQLGESIARLHNTTDSLDAAFELPVHDFNVVLDSKLHYAEQYMRAEDYAYLEDTARQLSRMLDNYPREFPDFGPCHCDLVMSNIRFDPRVGITYFDFGNISNTWRIYDLSVALRSISHSSELEWDAILGSLAQGYTKVRALPAEPERQMLLMQILGYMGWIGGNAATLPLRRGTEPMEGDIFDRTLHFIRDAMERVRG